MPNGNCVLNELDFERKIQTMPDRQLLEFVARQNYTTEIRCVNHAKRITSLESGNQRMSSLTGGISGTIAGIIIGIISYFTKGQ